MGVFLLVCVLQLMLIPALSLIQPVHDYWGEFGPYGPCSRTCGTGVFMRTRKCITSRTDGGHNCLGSSKSYRICNTQECPAGSRDFREEQCSQIDRSGFQGKHHTWVPYNGASNPCELNCTPRGENFAYRHRPAVVDGTKCYVGRNDICIDGVCRTHSLGEIMGLDEDSNSVHSSAPLVVTPHLRETHTHAYKVDMYGACSATCNGGMQYRSVKCWIQDPQYPRVVDETFCITQRLQRPASQQVCNMHPCMAEYRVSSFSVCSVSCGEGQQTREVYCVGSSRERLPDHACSSLSRPESVQTCRRPACQTHITWHVTDFGLCTRSCGGGVRERRMGCFDTDLNPYPETRCGAESRPQTVESCNSHPCPGAQYFYPLGVPSVQDPRTYETTMRGFVPHVPEDPTGMFACPASRPHVNTADAYPPVVVPRCAQTYYGCCPDGHTPAAGPRYGGCFHDDCVRSRFGCCLDGVTPAQGFGRAGCPEYQTTAPPAPSPAQRPAAPSTDVCALPRDDGPCDTWKVRFYFDSAAGKCIEFWYGNCEGNGNNFLSLEACQRHCGTLRREAPAPRGGSPRVTAVRARV
ncbi:papilin b, proteoglycan-like sulfated glycoprotein [Eucyclogobius newberryi]|uniref:papilin b, proteoglycan-like sulfated glycoprotein n=1 Tax=Eucyclogobius newberryi TaxID=166745 RepID=UPI003B5AD899